jgi:hypothetical protein
MANPEATIHSVGMFRQEPGERSLLEDVGISDALLGQVHDAGRDQL